jgi:hypothetical protein
MNKHNSTIIGRYNRQGYTVVEIKSNGEETELYQAGNNPQDSGVSQSFSNGLSLTTLRKYCIETSREVAKERAVKYGGVERDEEIENWPGENEGISAMAGDNYKSKN